VCQDGIEWCKNVPEINAMGIMDDDDEPATLILLAPDNPTRNGNSALPGENGNRVCWLITDIADGDFTMGTTVCNYKQPKLFNARHRYVYLLFKGRIDPSLLCEEEDMGAWNPTMREDFNLIEMVRQNPDLQLKACNFFYSEAPPRPPVPRQELVPTLLEAYKVIAYGDLTVASLTVAAQKKFEELDVDDSGVLEDEEIYELAAWVWQSFRPNQEPSEKQIEKVRQLHPPLKGVGAVLSLLLVSLALSVCVVLGCFISVYPPCHAPSAPYSSATPLVRGL